MAEEQALTGLVSGFTTGMGVVADVILWIMIAGILIGSIWLLMYINSFKIRITIRDVANNRKIIRYDKGRIVKTKTGKYYFQFLKAKRKIEAPKDSCYEIDKKGKKQILFYYVSEDDSFVPIEDKFDYQTYKSDNFKTIEPFTSNQREGLMYEWREAESYKKKKLGEQLLALAPYFILILILAVFMIFFENVVQPTKDMAQQLGVVADKMEQSLEHMENIALERQKLQGQSTINANGSLSTGQVRPIPN